jgi:hypothetical protein
VNRAVMQMDELTQQNAALVEQATAASQGMTTEAGGLNEMMARYDFTGVATGSNGTHYETLHAAATSDTKSTDAATDKKPATTSATARAERRKANRPWANPPTRSQSPAASRPEAAVASITRVPVRADSGKDNSEWQEF